MGKSGNAKILLLTILGIWIAGIIVAAILTNDGWNRYDAADYWKRGCSIWSGGMFSLLNIPNGFRGYVYPLYLGICGIFGQKSGFIVINSLITALFMVLIVPGLHGVSKVSGVRCAVSYALFAILFTGLIIYSLSDLFAIVLCSTAIILEDRLEGCGSWKKGIVYSLLLGAAMYMMYNVRTIYMFSNLALLIKILWYFWRGKFKIKSCVTILGGSMIGGTLAAFPQIYMNYNMLGIVSIKVPTNGLMLKQVFWGINFQRYDTYIGKAPEHPGASMYFQDPAGSRLLNEMGIGGFAGWGDFLLFCLKHPVDVFGIYVRHFVNMLFPCWPGQYVKDLGNSKIFMAAIALVMFFTFGLAVLNRFTDTGFWKNYAVLLTPILFILPGAVEIRFFAAMYIMVIGVLCYSVRWKELWKYVLGNMAKVITCFSIYSGLVIAIWSGMLASDPACGIYF